MVVVVVVKDHRTNRQKDYLLDKSRHDVLVNVGSIELDDVDQQKQKLCDETSGQCIRHQLQQEGTWR